MTIFDCDQGEFNCFFTVGHDVVARWIVKKRFGIVSGNVRYNAIDR
jgi:hypothetical protein